MTDKHLRLPEVMEATGLGKTTIYRLMANGQFPKQIKLSQMVVAWPESVISEWLEERRKASLEAA